MSAADMSSFTGVFRAQLNGDGQRRVAKRHPVSCTPCRTRKLKCDRQKPVCGTCVKRDEAGWCKYQPQSGARPRAGAAAGTGTGTGAGAGIRSGAAAEAGSGGRGDAGQQTGSAPKQEVAVRLQRLEEMVNAFVHCDAVACMNGNGNANGSGIGNGNQPSLFELREGPVADPGSSGIPAAPDHVISSGSGGSAMPSSLIAAQTTEGVFVGATNWLAVLESIHDIQGYLESDADADAAALPLAMSPAPLGQPLTTDLDFVFGFVEPLTVDEVLASLPSRTDCDRLLNIFFQAKLPRPPLLHLPYFQRCYDAFWTDPVSTSLLWISMLCSTLWIAVLQLSSAKMSLPRSVSGDDVFSLDRLQSLAARCLVSGDYLNCKPFAPEALVMIYLTQLYQSQRSSAAAWSVVALAVRVAQRMGYHRDPARVLRSPSAPAITAFQGEMRRRAWYMVETFDVLCSFHQGVPPSVHEADCDTDYPQNLRDEDFDESSAALPLERPFTDVTPILYFCFKARLMRLLRRISRHALSTRLPEYAETRALDAELHALHDRIPPALRIRPLGSSHSFADSASDVLQRMEIELAFCKCLCVLHRSYLTYEKDNPRYEESRAIARDAALRSLRIHADFEAAMRPGGKLEGMNYLLACLTLSDFLLGAMILCLDLAASKSTDADRMTEITALQDTHRIWSAHQDTWPDASRAVNVLGSLIRKVATHIFDSAASPSDLRSPPPPPPPPPPPSAPAHLPSAAAAAASVAPLIFPVRSSSAAAAASDGGDGVEAGGVGTGTTSAVPAPARPPSPVCPCPFPMWPWKPSLPQPPPPPPRSRLSEAADGTGRPLPEGGSPSSYPATTSTMSPLSFSATANAAADAPTVADGGSGDRDNRSDPPPPFPPPAHEQVPDLMQLDPLLDDMENLDWNVIDSYIMNRASPEATPQNETSPDLFRRAWREGYMGERF